MVSLVSVAVVAALLSVGAGPGSPSAERRVYLGERISVVIPDGYRHEVTTLGDKGALLTLDDGRGVLLLTVYDGDKVPSRAKALGVHADELRRRVSAVASQKTRAALLGARKPARELRFEVAGAALTARVVAAHRFGETVVASWAWPDDQPAERDALSALVETVTTQPRAAR